MRGWVSEENEEGGDSKEEREMKKKYIMIS